ncbi:MULTISPECIES: potassium channel family protein [unclassified Streptomyces]|uniref:potassium channel family protein n=1 Tax=unclassified Streptomyces TaxID=2593676 RepID=UPI00203002FF|nr:MULTISPECIES: potassium channel family protein [unclassified Streptomyces]MCM1966056.1 potassium channel family protein [Streptomyces sp. G1]MCX5126903.1 potassium channel family protein [Streptomyces sp. NBC_00347]
MNWLFNVAGAVLVLFVLRDVFHTLWHPTRHGGLSRLVMTGLWRLSTSVTARRRASGLAGPVAMVAVVAVWALTVVVGWALIYWPHMPDAFTYTAGLRPTEHASFVDALYISLVNVSTLGLGDIAPTEGWLRILAPLEALVGFALLTATVSWTLGIYPALARRRALALRLSHLARTHPTTDQIDTDAGAAVLDSLAAGISVISVDFMQYAESYYFYDGDDRTSLALHMTYADNLADQAALARHPDVRLAAAVLRAALEDLAVILDQRFLHTRGAARQVFEAFARDHGRHAGA